MTTTKLPWRKVAEEAPPERMVVDTLTVHHNGSVEQRTLRIIQGRWYDRNLAGRVSVAPTHWRPAFRFAGEVVV